MAPIHWFNFSAKPDDTCEHSQVSCCDNDNEVQHGLLNDPFFGSHRVFMNVLRLQDFRNSIVSFIHLKNTYRTSMVW